MNETSLLTAVEDNIAWCGTVCAAHRSDERNSDAAWVNIEQSPPYYPNIITRQPNAQAEVTLLVDEVRRIGLQGPWGIKDSFHDLDLAALDFTAVIEGQWFARAARPRRTEHDWKMVRQPEDLLIWEQAWGGNAEHRIFMDSLLDDQRIRFWKLQQQDEILAGCITFSSRKATGLSNWFSRQTESIFDLGIMPAIAGAGGAGLVVCWAAEDDAPPPDFQPLGRLRVWMSNAAVA